MPFQAIRTKYIGPSNIKGSRVKAFADAGSVTLHWDDSLNSSQNHAKAAEALAMKLGWWGAYMQGSFDNGYCFVWADEAPAINVPNPD